jgi:hypothetical protein
MTVSPMVTGVPREEIVMTATQVKCQNRVNVRRVGFAIALVVSAISLSTPSFALGTAEQQKACTPDVMRFCMSALGSDTRMLACMLKQKPNLSPACRTAMDGH